MKKSNRKGFTLVELLATVVILSIVTGVSVPVTTSIVATSKYRSLSSIVDDAENFLSDQWKINKISPDTVNSAFNEAVLKPGYTTDSEKILDTKDTAHPEEKLLLEEMGINTEDVKEVKIIIDDQGIGCVIITKIPKTSKLYNGKYWKDSSETGYVIPRNDTNDRYYSKCCPTGRVEVTE